MPSDKTLIVGAGLAGLSCAHHLGGAYEVFERADVVGGAARSFEREGFTFDVTGHWLHLRDPDVKALALRLLDGEWLEIERVAEIHTRGVRTPYPFQANTFGHDPEVIADCLLGYFRAREAHARGEYPAPRSFEDFIRQRMGDGIADHFMVPYNTKLWTVPPSDMDHVWCERFVPVPDPEHVVRGALRPTARSTLGYNATFRYPRRGGIGRLAGALARELEGPVHLETAVTRVDWRNRQIALSDGSRRPYRTLVSTLPLDRLVGMLVDGPQTVLDAASQLRATSVTYWDVGVAGANRRGDAHWTYFPDPDVPFYRVGSPSAAVAQLAPPDHRSYYVEVSHRPAAPCPASDDDIVAGLRRVGLLGPGEEPMLLHRSTIPCAYVIMDHAYGGARATILDWLASENILSIGRYGSWTYDSMEGALLQGRDAARHIVEGADAP